MTRLVLGIFLAAAVGACAPRPDATPDAVYLRAGDIFQVNFNDGTSCRAPATPTGTLSGCAHPLTYSIEKRNSPISEATGGLTEPFADITLRGNGRVWQFETPASRNWTGVGQL